MIRIIRPAVGPPNLKRWGEKQTKLDCAAYDSSPDDYTSGNIAFPKKTYYSKQPVKDLLISIQHGKCCYCEQRFPRKIMDVEHFRPKAGVRQKFDQPNDEFPGYYWLAYSWENLFLSCPICNGPPNKGTRFPLANPGARVRSHHDSGVLRRERPLFIDPARENPRDHIYFVYDAPKARTRKGQSTIKGIGLREGDLPEARLKKLSWVNREYDFIKLAAANPEIAALQIEADIARRKIRAAALPNARFSSMVIDYLPKLPLL